MFQLVQHQDLLILALILLTTSLSVETQVQHIHQLVAILQSVLTLVQQLLVHLVVIIFILDTIQVVRRNPVITTLQSVVVQEEI